MNVRRYLVVAMLSTLLGAGSAALYADEGAGAPPRHFLVLMRLGPRYDRSLTIHQQKEFPAHAAYMNDLESRGTVTFGGPLLEDFASMRPTGGVLVVRAETAEEARRIADADPSGLLEVEAIRPVLVSIGARREEGTND
jgi:uncharacterized protein YciI